jgi:hypothetical protein
MAFVPSQTSIVTWAVCDWLETATVTVHGFKLGLDTTSTG